MFSRNRVTMFCIGGVELYIKSNNVIEGMGKLSLLIQKLRKGLNYRRSDWSLYYFSRESVCLSVCQWLSKTVSIRTSLNLAQLTDLSKQRIIYSDFRTLYLSGSFHLKLALS